MAASEVRGRPGLGPRTRAAVALGRLAGRASRLTGRGGGGTIPGRVALAVDPGALPRLVSDARVSLVSGTNGKTTTTRMLVASLGSAEVVTNASGANLATGLVAALISPAARRAREAVLEVDEIALPAALRDTRAALVLLLNLSRDQLDRTGEVARHVGRWRDAIAASPTTQVVANADDPLVAAAVLGARPGSDRVTWVGAGVRWTSDAPFCPACGSPWVRRGADWRCSTGDLSRPTPAWWLEEDRLHGPGGLVLDVRLALPGRANRANAAVVVAAATHLGEDAAVALARVAEVRGVAGRYVTVERHGRRVRLLLAKNPAGWTELLADLPADPTPAVVAINARVPDGTDPSWLWDSPFERLAGRPVTVTGDRAADLAVRLHYAEVPHTRAADVLAAIDGAPEGDVLLLANYTAFQDARVALGERG